MKYLIANKNILIKTFSTETSADEYIKSQGMCGDECQFEGIYFSHYELVEKGAKQGQGSIWGVDWDNLILFNDDYKNAIEEKYKKSLRETIPLDCDYIFGED